ncbi:MAG: PepSY-like domain-containing protein [Chitinophagales bacterium]|nr:PepSY-like domain-containing protein [Chitinophagales bacterium]
MKKVINILFVTCFASAVTAQTPAVPPAKKPLLAPAPVEKAFEQKFPNATNLHWGKESLKEWEAEFVFKGENISANFTSDGKWVETEKEIKASEFPKAVAEAIQKQYPGWIITEADITQTEKNGTIYEAAIKNGKLKKGVAFKEDGIPVKE